MKAVERFHILFTECPLIAILRGVRPGEVQAIGAALFGAGIRLIEVPLNSPDALESISRLADRFGSDALVGAGTVLTPHQVAEVREAGGQMVVSPNTDAEVIRHTVAHGMVSAPGCFTPSEALAALMAGAHALKLFPAEAAPPAVVRAQRAVLPATVPLIAVGSIKPESMAEYMAAGANGFGLGGGLYRPGDDAAQVAERARVYLDALAGSATE